MTLGTRSTHDDDLCRLGCVGCGPGTTWRLMLLRLEPAAGKTIFLSEEQIRLLERHSVNFRYRHMDACTDTMM
jgi:hypothetical protein